MNSVIHRRVPATLVAAAICFIAAWAFTAGANAQPADDQSASRVEDINRNWRFAKGPQEGAEAAGFDDSGWQQVRLPHDWAIAGPFDPELSGNTGSLPWQGEGWYRKTFTLPASDAGKQVYIDFDAVMAHPTVYINGERAGGWDYGYAPFRIDATEHVRPGQENTIAVHVDTSENVRSRWYPGAGIYRKVYLTVNDPVHIAHWGNFITTPSVEDNQATVSVQTALENHSDSEASTRVEVTILDADGQEVASSSLDQGIAAGGSADFTQTLAVENPTRWDVDNPYLYTAKTNVYRDGQLVDTHTSNLGFRTFSFSNTDGMQVNGRRVQIYGVNLHHAHGPLGAAFYTRAMERQLEIMKDMGVNFLRTSHNIPAQEVLDLCDRMGIIVWDEAFDKWDGTAHRPDEEPLLEYNKRQLENFVKRDRNHPSVFLWSIGNEIGDAPAGATPEEHSGKSEQTVSEFSEFIRTIDPTRPVTIGSDNSDESRPILTSLDVTGWNYGRRYDDFYEAYPEIPILYSESASTLSTRGYYDFEMPSSKTDQQGRESGQVTSYDLNAPSWADILDQEFALMERDTFVAGEMVWTGFDYLGEPTGGGPGARSSYFGIVDLVGIPKDRYYLYRSYWRPEETTIHILPHWNWPDRVGKTVPVFVYTNGDSAELFLNGRSLGRRTKGEVPEDPQDIAAGKTATASSSDDEQGNVPSQATDGDSETRWAAADDSTGQWLQVDLGEVQRLRHLKLEFDNSSSSYDYDIQVSTDGENWETVVEEEAAADDGGRGQGRFGRGGGRRGGRFGRRGGGRRGGGFGRRGRGRGGAGAQEVEHQIDTQGRYVRIEFTGLRDDATASLRELRVYPRIDEPEYYDVTYQYRLRWNDVIYQPGELRVVVYKDGASVGEKVLRTADEPAEIRLTPDRTELSASGEDLCYILVEAYDENGNLAPLADNMIQFSVDGPARIAGIGNGNPLSMEPYQDDEHSLFYGKAMLVLKTEEGEGGPIQVSAESEGLEGASVTVQSAQ